MATDRNRNNPANPKFGTGPKRHTSAPPEKQAGDRQRRRVVPRRFKTALCRNFEATGKCEFGANCIFAHGAHELRELNMEVVEKSCVDQRSGLVQEARQHDENRRGFGEEAQPSSHVVPEVQHVVRVETARQRVMTSLPSAHSLVTNPAGSAVDLHCDPDAVDRALTALRKFDHRSGSLALNKLWRRAGLHRPRIDQ